MYQDLLKWLRRRFIGFWIHALEIRYYKNTETKSFTEKVEENSSNMKVGDYALNFKLQNLNGEIVDLFKFVGNIDFVNIFWYNILMKLVIEVIEWLQKI